MVEREKHIRRPGENGNVAISAPITGPDRSVMNAAVTTNAAAMAIRSPSVRMRGSSGDMESRNAFLPSPWRGRVLNIERSEM